MRRYLLNNAALAAVVGLSFVACQHQVGTEPIDNTPPGQQTSAPPGTDPPGSDVPPAPITPPSVVTIPPGSSEPAAPSTAMCPSEPGFRDPYMVGYTQDPNVVAEAQSIVGMMDINQKVRQLVGIPDPGVRSSDVYEDIQRSEDEPALNLRGYQWRDGPHGLNLEAGLGRTQLRNYATSFPTSVAQGATFNTELMYEVGKAIGDETVAAGNSVMLSPCMNILRHPYWGRAQETFGEDVFHLGRIASAFTIGLQEFITGCAKHYAGNNIEVNRMSINAQMDEQTLREIYGRHFEMVVKDGGVGCIMASYNLVNGTKATQNKHLLTTILRDDFGFKGFVLTDWWAMPGGQGPINAPDDGFNAKQAIEAGLDVEVPWALNFDAIPQLVNDGALNLADVNRSVERVIEQKLRFNSAYLDQSIGLSTPTTQHVEGAIVNNDHHVELARETAEQAMVLLKNDEAVLPVKPEATKVAVIGASVEYEVRSDNPPIKTFDFLNDVALGDRGSSRVRPNPEQIMGPLDGITAAAPAGVEVVGGADATVAEGADVAVVVVGLTAGDEGEEYTGAGDRETLDLPAVHNELIQSVAATGVPTVVIIQSGGVVSMPWLNEVKSVIMAWYPGQQSGAAMGNLLFGHSNFSGRLPVTWPTDVSQFPDFNEGQTTVMDYYLGYRRFDVEGLTPLYAFGHGLSYSTFEYLRVAASCGTYPKDGVIQLEVDVQNTSDIDGAEVIQVYASYPQTQARRSVKELKGFHRVELAAGEAKRVTIPIRVSDLKYWSGDASGSWVVESGPVLLRVGPSSDNLPLEYTVQIQ